ncbi:MAG: cyclic pyranopterin monophosphate synthase MoaC [Chthoniobacterales bacterium]
MSEFSHLDKDGSVRMVDVSAKPLSARIAKAAGAIRMAPETIRLISENRIAKGNVLATAKIAAIQAAKRTSDWIPLCHPLPLSGIDVEFVIGELEIQIICEARTTAQTGVEMEALTAVSAAALTLYDMCKAVDKAMVIVDIRLLSKEKRPLTD